MQVGRARSAYQAGARGWQWIKLKRDYRTELSDTVNLVVIGAFAGRGRRAGGTARCCWPPTTRPPTSSAP